MIVGILDDYLIVDVKPCVDWRHCYGLQPGHQIQYCKYAVACKYLVKARKKEMDELTEWELYALPRTFVCNFQWIGISLFVGISIVIWRIIGRLDVDHRESSHRGASRVGIGDGSRPSHRLHSRGRPNPRLRRGGRTRGHPLMTTLRKYRAIWYVCG